jgi:DNA topoisomerase IB
MVASEKKGTCKMDVTELYWWTKKNDTLSREITANKIWYKTIGYYAVYRTQKKTVYVTNMLHVPPATL